MDSRTKCAACGLLIEVPSTSEKQEYQICHICTLNGEIAPNFETTVYRVAIRNEKNTNVPLKEKDLVKQAYKSIAHLPYWQHKQVPTIPHLKQFKKVKQLLHLVEKTNHLKIDEQLFEPRDFFISHKWHDQCDNELVDPLVKVLKARGYRIWYDKDTWAQEAGEKKEWMKRGIEQARHCIVIVCKDYLSSEACKYELETMFHREGKEKFYIHPIWWTDVTKESLEKDELGKQILAHNPIKWKKEDIIACVDRLVEQANAVEGIKIYNEVKLRADEARMIQTLETLLDEPIPVLEAKDLKKATFGFCVDKTTNQITILLIQEKKLKSLPASLGQCLGLKTLDLTNNDLYELPSSFEQLRNLETLNIQGNQMQLLPPSFKTVHKHLIPQYPEVEQAEAEILALLELLLKKPVPRVLESSFRFGYIIENNHVTGLDLSDQRLKSLPKSFGNLKSLKKLNLRRNQLNSLPESFGDLKKRQVLELNQNQLRSLPETFKNLKNLQTLVLEFNKLKSLPENFGQLSNLETLRLGRNNLRSLPESIEGLTNLKALSLYDNKLVSLPEIKWPPNLTFLNLGGNRLSSLPKSSGHLTDLKELRLDYNQLSSLPKSLGNLNKLERLYLIGNQLKILPKLFGNLTNLKTLELHQNQLISLPETFEALNNLTRLCLKENRLSSLPVAFGRLQNLKHLELQENELNSLPETFGNLRNLDWLDLARNQLSSLPEDFGQLQSLRHLNLHGNQMTSLPEDFGQLQSLRHLNLHGNQLRSLPGTFSSLTNLRELELGDNPLKTLPE
ncbi:MAG: leucine-rich repeat domain-containing protein, partial [Candidatus Hodarchaeota archaeon]